MFVAAEKIMSDSREAFAKGSAAVDLLLDSLISSRGVVDSAIGEAIAEIRRQRQLIAQLTGENQHLREINHAIAEQASSMWADKPAQEKGPELSGTVQITTEGNIPPEVRALLEAVVHLINNP
jgi:hypothetical protein